MVDDIILEYDFCDIVLGKVRGLNSEEKEQMYLWLGKQLDAISMRQRHAIMNSHDLVYKILDRGVFQGHWKNIGEAKKSASELLSYVRRYKQVPIVKVRVNEPEYPPEYRVAKMKSQGYSDGDIIDKAKTLGLKETKVREIINDHIKIQTSFDMKAFCSVLKKAQKELQ